MFPVGMILNYGISAPVVRGGRVVAFHDAFQVRSHMRRHILGVTYVLSHSALHEASH